MQNKTDKGTLLVSKSLPVANSNSVNRLFSKKQIAVPPDVIGYRFGYSGFCRPNFQLVVDM